MTLDISKYQVINDLDNEKLIGYSNNIFKLYSDYAKELIDECCYDEIYAITKFLDRLYSDSVEWYAPYLIAVGCDDLGRYYYRILVETECVGGK